MMTSVATAMGGGVTGDAVTISNIARLREEMASPMESGDGLGANGFVIERADGTLAPAVGLGSREGQFHDPTGNRQTPSDGGGVRESSESSPELPGDASSTSSSSGSSFRVGDAGADGWVSPEDRRWSDGTGAGSEPALDDSSNRTSINNTSASFMDEFDELLSSEVTVDVESIRAAAYHGIPDKVRGEVWLYLLGVRPPSKHMAIEHTKQLEERYLQIETDCKDSKRIAFETRKLRDKELVFQDEAVIRKIRNVVSAYCSERGISFSAHFVLLACTLAAVIDSEAEAFAAFCAVMDQIDELEPLVERSAKCMSMVRATLPEVVRNCEDEDLNLRGSIAGWLEGMLVLNIPLESVLVLWDTYLARGFWFHSYMCIGLLDAIQEKIEDVDEMEFRQTMNYTPITEIHEIIVAAENLYASSTEPDSS
eukprot:m.29020 g.29020  ORF g.29020 m.29020 type:complete len:425 (-) comp12074_c0_seq1:36-1310(-)